MGLFKNDIGRKIVAIKGKFFMRLSQNFFEQQKDINGNVIKKLSTLFIYSNNNVKITWSKRKQVSFYHI